MASPGLTGLLPRSLAVIVAVLLLAGLSSLGYTIHATGEGARAATQTRLQHLLDTVERTLQAACFVGDEALAREIVQGLLANGEVLAARIDDRGGRTLALALREDTPPPADTLAREVPSPFGGSDPLCRVSLAPDPAFIDAQVNAQVRLATLQLGWQLALVGAAMAAAMLLFVIRPIAAMSNRMHRLDPTAGERLPVPVGHARSELGRLAGDINMLADRLVRALEDERALRRQREVDERKYHAIFDNAESGIFIVNQAGVVSSWNRAFARLLGLAETPAGLLHLTTLPWNTPDDARALLQRVQGDNGAAAGDLALRGADGARRWLNLVLSPIGDGLLQGVAHDVSELKEAEASARRLALTDPLTGLANRLGLEERLRQHCKHYTLTRQGGFALLLVDLDNFRHINEGIGLPAGDEVLRLVTTRLSEHVKHQDTVARLSADHFAVVLHEVAEADTAQRVVSRILAALRQAYFVEGAPITLHASIGITLFPHDGTDMAGLLRHAELAVDKAKRAGGNTGVFFDPTLAEMAEQRRHLENDLRQAVRERHFVLYYQPVVDLRANRLAGAEALIRWRHPVRGLVPPDRFIPLAEQSGLIDEIGLWALDSACAQLARWRAQGLDYQLSLNVSGRQIPHGLSAAMVAEALARHGVPAASLALEITEGVLLADVEQAQAWLESTRALGCRVYLDDFGTGYSSLSYLKRFPVDTLKVDKSFVLDMGESGSGRALVEAIVALARSLVLEVVAEGTEDAQHVRLLREMDCHYAQGYHFSPPVPAEDFPVAAERIAGLLAAP